MIPGAAALLGARRATVSALPVVVTRATTATGSTNVSIPAGETGDIQIAIAAVASTSDFTLSGADWTLVGSYFTVDASRVGIFQRTLAAPISAGIETSSVGGIAAATLTFRKTGGASIIQSANTSGFGSVGTAPALAGVGSGSLILTLLGFSGATTGITSTTVPKAATLPDTDWYDVTSLSFGGRREVFFGSQAVDGTRSVTFSGNRSWGAVSMELG